MNNNINENQFQMNNQIWMNMMNNNFNNNNINNPMYNQFQMNNQIWMNMMNNNCNNNNINNPMYNPNFMNNMNQMQNQINPLMNVNVNEQMNYINLNKRIIELENIIKKKDIEIAKLKEKLAKSNSFDYIFSPNRDEIDEIDDNAYNNLELNIEYNPPEKSDDKFRFKVYCNFDEKTRSIKKRIFKKLSEKFNIKFRYLKFLYNCYDIKDELTASELGLTNGCNIIIFSTNNIKGAGEDNKLDKKNEIQDNSTINYNKDKIEIIFRTTGGSSQYIFVDREVPIIIVVIYYFLINEQLNELIGFINGSKNIIFIFNASPLNIKDKKTVEEFIGNANPIIIVYSINNLIGG